MIRRRRLLLVLAALLALARPAAADASLPTVLFLGDSLSAGYGLAAREAFPAAIERAMRERGRPIRVVNAGVSGDTTAGGLARLDWVLRQEPDVVVVGLGGNDGLRGQPLDAIERNLRAIVDKVRAAGARPILLEMALPPSYGRDYVDGFVALYGRIAADLDVPLVRGFLRGVGGVARLNLPDGIHPTAEGHAILAENVLPTLERVLAAQR